MLPIEIPSKQRLVEQAAQLGPILRKNARWAEENRRLHDDTIEALAEAGVFKLRTPARYGGYEADTQTLVDVAAEIGRVDGAPSWVASVYWIPTWMTGLFPDPVQDEVFSTPNVRVCGTLSPTATAAPAEGGVILNGKWGFISGAHHAHWQEIVAVLLTPDSEPMPIMALVPMSDLQIIDDWYTHGLQGTGSVSTVAEGVFVPQERILPLPMVLQGESASQQNASTAMYRAPLLPVASASSVGTLVGLAKGARDAFMESLPNRKITYTSYTNQAEAPLTHLQVAEATMKIDQAEFHAHRLAALVDGKCAEGSPWSIEERARARGDMGAVGALAKDAVDIFGRASGGSSVYDGVLIQQIQQDMHAASLHALMHPDTNTELYGRVLCGLGPNTLYI